MRELTKYGNYVSRAKIKKDFVYKESTIMKAQIADMKARKYVIIEQLKRDLTADQMIELYRKLTELEYQLQLKLSIYNGEWKHHEQYIMHEKQTLLI